MEMSMIASMDFVTPWMRRAMLMMMMMMIMIEGVLYLSGSKNDDVDDGKFAINYSCLTSFLANPAPGSITVNANFPFVVSFTQSTTLIGHW